MTRARMSDDESGESWLGAIVLFWPGESGSGVRSMGAWGSGVFENDAALDWVGELVESGDASRVSAALRSGRRWWVVYLDAWKSNEALAAAEVVSAACGVLGSDLPEDLLPWVEQHRSELVPFAGLALDAVSRVGRRSELRSLWAESDHFSEWLAVIRDLTRRLQQCLPG